MARLRVLDLRYNLLDDFRQCVAIVNALPRLEFIGFKGNKVAEDYPRFRKRLIGNLKVGRFAGAFRIVCVSGRSGVSFVPSPLRRFIGTLPFSS